MKWNQTKFFSQERFKPHDVESKLRMLNSSGYFAGMSHGFMLSRHLDSVSLSLAIVMSVMMVSGLLLKYTSSRNSKIFGKLLHGQFGLVILLAALVTLQIVVGDD